MKIVLTPSTRRTKKWTVRIDDRTVHFGARGSSDYTINKDPKRRAAYIARHRKREDWNDPYTAGFWSRWLLWEKPSLQTAIKNIERKFRIDIVRT